MSALLYDYPDSEIEVDGAGFHWWGCIQPTSMSVSYLVKISWQPKKRSVVRVLDPELKDRHGERPPHTFGDRSLCLHLPGEWSSEDLLSTTLVPWTSMWLLFYEVWQYTGEWTGGGHEFGIGDDPVPDQRRSGLSGKRNQQHARGR